MSPQKNGKKHAQVLSRYTNNLILLDILEYSILDMYGYVILFG